MTKKVFLAKLNADLAMLAFVLITIVMLASTTVGVLAYVNQPVNQTQEAPRLSVPAASLTGQGG